MKKLKCSKCGTETLTLVSSKKGGLICKSCKDDERAAFDNLYLGIDCFPADGVFLEHVSPEGHTFKSRGEMRDWEKRTGTMIGYLH